MQMKVTDDNIQTLLRESEEAYTNAYRDFVNDFNKVAYTDYVYKAVEDYEKAVKEYVGKLKYIINTVLNSDTDDNDTENTESTESTESTENNSNKNEDVDYEKYSKVENVETVELNARIKESFSVIGEASGELIKRGYKKAAEVIKSGMKTGADKVADFVDTVYSNIENDADEDDNFGEDLTKEEIVENITDLDVKGSTVILSTLLLSSLFITIAK